MGLGGLAISSLEGRTIPTEECEKVAVLDWMPHPPAAMIRGSRPLGMHEMSIMEATLEVAAGQARKAGADRICVVTLRIGSLSGVVPDALRFAFDALSPGTPAGGAELRIETVPASFWCSACQARFQADNLLAVCPSCQSLSRELLGGRELELTSLEVE